MAQKSPKNHTDDANEPSRSTPKLSKVEQNLTWVLQKINDITRNQFIIDLMILIQGINFLTHPETAHKGIIQTLATTIFFAALSILIGFALSHGFNKKNLRQILIALGFTTLSVAVYFTASFFAPAFHYFLSLAIIASGFFNTLSAHHLTKLFRLKKSVGKSVSASPRPVSKDPTIQSVSGTVERATKYEAERVFSPAVVLSSKISKFRYGQLIINYALILIGILMLLFRFQTNAILLRLSGGILIFSAVSDVVALLWTHRESAIVQKFTHYLAPPNAKSR